MPAERIAFGLGVVLVQLGLVLAAAPTLLSAAGIESVARACHHLPVCVPPGGAVTGWASALASLALLAVALVIHRPTSSTLWFDTSWPMSATDTTATSPSQPSSMPRWAGYRACRPARAALRLSIERAADEEATERPGAREAIRGALLKTTETMLGPVPAFTAAFTFLAA